MEGDRAILPDDVLFEEILVRLPVKLLILCKIVSKKWLRRIEATSFAEIHRRRRRCDYSVPILVFSPFVHSSDPVTRSSSLLPCSAPSSLPASVNPTPAPLNAMLPAESTRIQWPDVEPDEHYEFEVKVSVLGPLKPTGVYCVIAELRYGRRHPLTKITICNPSIISYKLLTPYPPEEAARISDLADGHFVRVSYGFGVAADGDYKVVAVITWDENLGGQDDSGVHFVSFVYSLRKGEWTKIVDSTADMVSGLHFGGEQSYPQIFNFDNEVCPQVFLNGCWHWIARFNDNRSMLLSFDVDNEVFKLFRGPPTDGIAYTTRILTTLNDRLAMVLSYWRPRSFGDVAISVRMMMEYGDEESWVNVWTVGRQYTCMLTLVGISYSLREDEDGNSSGGIRIHKLLYQDNNNNLFSGDESGVTKEKPGFDPSSCIFWNNIGISAYSETLDHL